MQLKPFLLDAWFDQYERDIEFNLAASTGPIWTAFPWLVSGASDRRFWLSAAEHGILLAPGDCFDVPSHFRLGFAVVGGNFSKALDRFGAFVKSWSAKMVRRDGTRRMNYCHRCGTLAITARKGSPTSILRRRSETRR
jgi:hypothetical protein